MRHVPEGIRALILSTLSSSGNGRNLAGLDGEKEKLGRGVVYEQ